MEKKYIDYATGEKVTLEEWNRRKKERENKQKAVYAFSPNPPKKNIIPNNPLLKNTYADQKLPNIPNNPITKNTYADRGLEPSKPIINSKKYIDEVTGERVTLDEYNKRKRDPTYYKQELKKINSLKNSFDITNYKDRSEKFNRLDNAIKKIELNEVAKKTDIYNKNLIAERSELERVTQDKDFYLYATKGREAKNNNVYKIAQNARSKTGNYYSPGYEYMTSKEMDVYNYYFGKYGAGSANSYLKTIQRDVNQRMTAEKSKEAYKFGQEHEILSYPVHALRSLGSGVGALLETTNQAIENKATGKFTPVDTNSTAMLLQNQQDAMTAGMVADNGPIGSFLTQTGLSIVDMAASLPFGKTGSLAIMSSSAAGSAALNAAQKGATPEKALTSGIVAGGIEYLTEKIGIDNLFKLAGKPSRSIAWAIASQVGAEGSEEFISQYANYIADLGIMGNNSDYNNYIDELMRVGFTREQAEHDAKRKFLLQDPLKAFLGGAISGGVFGAAGSTYGRVNAGNTLLQDTNAALRAGTQAGGQAAETSARIQQNILDGKNPSAWEMGGLAADINDASQKEKIPTVTIRTGKNVDTDTKTFLEKVANKTGINIEVAEIYDKSGKQMSNAEGYYDRSQNKMVFAPDTSKANIIKGVVMHELTHSIEGSKFYEEYSDFAINTKYKNQQEFENEIQAKIQQYAKQNVELKPIDAQKEIVAELTRNTIFDEASINKLVAEKPNIAVQVYQSIVKAIDTAKAYLTGDTETLELEKARKLFEKALNDRGVNTGTDTPQMSIKDNSFEQKFITDDSGKTHIRNVDLISDSDWNKIAKGFRQLGYDIRGTDDAKRLFSRYDKASFNDDQVTKLRQIFGGESEQTDNQLNKERAAKAARHFGTTTDFKEAGYILHNGNMLDFSGKKDGGPRGQRAMDHREISPVFDDETGDGYSEYMVRFMKEGNIRMSYGTGVDIGPIEPTKNQYSTLQKFIEYQMSKKGFFVLDMSSEKGYSLESREYDKGTPSSKIINDIKTYFKTGELPDVSDVQKFRYSIKDASIAGATADTTEDAKREWKEKGTDSKYFKKWFGDSKVVDENGEPLVVYHGTPVNLSDIDVMKRDYRGTIWVTPQAANADNYSGRINNMLELYAKIENPYVENVPYNKEWDIDDLVRKARSNGHDGLIINRGTPKFLEDAELHIRLGGERTAKEYFGKMNENVAEMAFEGEKISDFLERMGNTLYSNIAVFSPTQIKSATDNIGTFDEGNPDIRYSVKDNKQNTKRSEFYDDTKPIVKAVVNDLLKTYDSEYDSNKLENEVSDLYKKMQTSLVDGTGEYTEEELGNMARDIAAKILENMRLYEGVLSDEEKDLLKHLRKSRISIDSVNKSDLADDYNTFRKRFMGNLLLVKNGLPVDSFYKELASLYPQYFNEEEHSNPGDQLQHIADVIDEIKSRLPVNDYKDDKKEIGNIVREMLKGYFKILTMPKTTEQKSKVDTAKIKHKISQFYENTIKRATAIPQEVKDKLNPEDFDFIPESSKEWQSQAEKNVNADMDGVIERLKNAPSISGGIEGHEAAVIAKRLVDNFKKSGNAEDFKKMQDFLKIIASKTRESARALKATDTSWDKTDPAAAVIRAERTVQKVIEDEKRRNPKKFEDAKSEKKQLQTKMKNAEKLAQKDKAQKKLSDEQTKKIEDKRKKQMLERWVRDTVPRAKQKNILEKIQEMYEAGAYNDEGLARLISEKRDIPYLSLDEVKKVIGYMDKANKLKEGSYEQRMAFSRAEQIVESKLPVTTRDKIKAFPRISILTGTRTQVRNVVGNVIHGTYEAARENTVGLLVDVITSKFTGERKLTGNAIGKTSAYMKGFNMGVSEWYKDIKNKVDTSPTRTRGEVKRNSRTFKSAFLNAIDSVVKKGLSLGDRPFYQGAYEARLYELGKLNEKAKTKMSMDEMVLEAQAYALDKVYQNDSTVKKVATRLRNVSTAIDNHFWQGVAEVGMTMTVPFTETPANIFDKVLENSPIGITKAAIELGKTKNGTFDQFKFVQSLSRGMTGTGLMALGAMLFAKGIISIEPYDEEYDKYKFLQSAGVQNYALKIGNKYYSLSWVEPIATPILIGAEILRGSDDDKNILENLFGTTKIAFDSFFEASFVQGISELFSSRSIGEGVAKKLLDAHSMFTPLSAFGKALAQWVDPYVRETKDDNALMQMLKERAAETPFLSKALPARIDVFGNEVKTLGGGNHAFNVFFNPANVTDYVTTEVHDEIIKMYDTTEDINVFPDYINKPEIKYDGNAVTLDEKGFEKHKKEIGRALYDEYEKLFKTDTYKSMTAGEKAKAIRDAKADIKNQANFKAIKSSGDFLSGLTQNKQLYYDKTDLKLEADYLERWEELTPQDNKTVRDARLYDAVSDAVKAFDKAGLLNKDNMARISQYAENKRKREPTMMDLNLLSVYRATGSVSVFNGSYKDLLEFTENNVLRKINYPAALLPELIAQSDSAVLAAYSKIMTSSKWLYMTAVQKQAALTKAKSDARAAYENELKKRYGAKIDTASSEWQAMTPQERTIAANKGYKIK